MREIKFRLFDIDLKTMTTPLNPVWFEEYNYHSDDLARCAEVERCVLMQYTGLKDKNGVEIYEGDIISDQYDKGAVEFDNARFYWPHGEEWGMIFDDQVEVIGNIYQNPELLEK